MIWQTVSAYPAFPPEKLPQRARIAPPRHFADPIAVVFAHFGKQLRLQLFHAVDKAAQASHVDGADRNRGAVPKTSVGVLNALFCTPRRAQGAGFSRSIPMYGRTRPGFRA